jgi:hypothetical protein
MCFHAPLHDIMKSSNAPADNARMTAPRLDDQIIDRLADLLWISDDIMEMIAVAPDGDEFAQCNHDVRAIYTRRTS